ncbi:MAG TPA: hypothetical protein VMU25_01625 [Candidatus Paceibacterota bacterium]|nr:hypothetical protein [Candidatus Paceibacterota bacterium]
MDARIYLARHADDARIKRISEHLLEAVRIELLAAASTQASLVQLVAQGTQGIGAGAIELERLFDQWSALGVGGLRLAAALIEIADWGTEWIYALLQSAAETFLHLLPKIADVVRGDDRQKISGEPSLIRSEIDGFLREANINALF